MNKLIITKIDNYEYYLKDEYDKNYKYNIEFYDLKNYPIVGDYIYVSDEFLKLEEELLSFGSLEGKYGKKITKETIEDVIVLSVNNEMIYLKRYYG